MTRLGLLGLAVVLVLTGCTVPSLEELENEQPRACNAQHACGEGRACVGGLCVAFVCDAGTPTLGYVDADRDGHGAVDAEAKAFCGSVPAGYATVRDDCDDSQALVYPGVREDCDGLDNNCTGGIDEGHARTEYFRDADGDAVGVGPAVQACRAPAGYVTTSGDCDDANPERAPGRGEVCNGVDDDCDGEMDEGFNSRWYLDDDADGYGRTGAATVSCTAPGANYVTRTGDCDDAFAAVNPGATEVCNNLDDNCSGAADETFTNKGMPCTDGNSCAGVYGCNVAGTATFCNAPSPTSYYPDVDGDLEGDSAGTAELRCVEAPAPSGKVANNRDCDDRDDESNTGEQEVCDAIDNNCNGQLDEGLTTCGGALRRVTDAATGNHTWRRVAVGPGGYPVWIAGLGGKLIRRASAGTPFEDLSYSSSNPRCGNYDWFAAWVRPSDGHVFLAGQGGRVAEHTGTECINAEDAPGSDAVSAMVGFESGGVTTLYMVSDGGRLFTWTSGSFPVERDNSGNYFYSIGAWSPNLLLVGGRNNGVPGQQFITEYAAGSLSTNTPHNLSNVAPSHVAGIKVWAPDKAYAVGEGTAIWRWNGARNWSLVTPPSGVAANFTGLAMPVADVDLVYIVGKEASGRFLRRTPFGWARAPALTPRNGEATTIDAVLHDIAMTSKSEFWMVGENGRVYHYPEQ